MPSRRLSRIAVAGISLAVLGLGVLSVWAAIATQGEARRLSGAGLQVSGHLRAVQASSMIDTETDALEVRFSSAGLARLRDSQAVLDDAIERMETGHVPEARRIGKAAAPIVRRLKPAIDAFLVLSPTGTNGTSDAEEKLEEITSQLEVLLNDLHPDPSHLLTSELAAARATERTVRGTALVLIPLGLIAAGGCGWLLALYRRRTDALTRESLERTATEARTDELTGLPNRRALVEELERCSSTDQPVTVMLADLNGFKRYNDTFGHPAGDELLKRLGRKLAAAAQGYGLAARLGGDEFCVLLDDEQPEPELRALLTKALSEHGEGFQITASSGFASMPAEARDPSAVLRLADSRMYAAKENLTPSAEHGMALVLTRMLDERHPGLASHVSAVGTLARACAEELGLSADDAGTIERAGEMHDLGKIAIPSAILAKPGPLNDEELEFMRRHSIIGERILSGIPPFEQLAALVRSSHERWDGRGYPDGLHGEEIPIGSRIIFVADAFCAMTETRPYAPPRSVEDARAELLACAGEQFDPTVVAAFLTALDGHKPALHDLQLVG